MSREVFSSDDIKPEAEDRQRCLNFQCDLRSACARTNDDDFDQNGHVFHGGLRDGTSCTDFVLRKALGRDNPDLVFTESRRRGRRHNAHAYTGPRTDYPGSRALFGGILGKPKKDRASGTPKTALPTKPDLMVTRHIRDGRNINDKED